jgi:hypothetical protein
MPPKMEPDPPPFPKATLKDPPSSAAERTRAYRQRRRLRLRCVNVRLSDAEIGALVRLGYLGTPDDIRAIEHAATAFISDALFGT